MPTVTLPEYLSPVCLHLSLTEVCLHLSLTEVHKPYDPTCIKIMPIRPSTIFMSLLYCWISCFINKHQTFDVLTWTIDESTCSARKL